MSEINERFISLRGKIPYGSEIKPNQTIQLTLEGAVLNYELFETKTKPNEDGTVDITYVLKFHSYSPIK